MSPIENGPCVGGNCKHRCKAKAKATCMLHPHYYTHDCDQSLSSHTETASVITRGILRGKSSSCSPLPSHTISRMSYRALEGEPIVWKQHWRYDYAKALRRIRRTRTTLKQSAKPRRATKEGQRVLRTPLHIRTLGFLYSACV